ncbi:MAG: DMT family transporter [Pseudomonadota bacterium]|nr:DMT family transporter [Pseudomonadota bacterium]
MGFRDFCLLFAVCFVWGLNLVVTRWVVADADVPPIFFAGLRFAGIALVLIPFLFPLPKQMGMLFMIAMCMGGIHFALLFMGLANAEASAVSVTGQLGVPFSTLMSMAFLGEKVGWRRGLGIMLAFAGVVLIAFDPDSFAISYGLLYVIASAFVGSIGGILMKRMAPISALQLQGWLGLFSFLPLILFSFAVEERQVETYLAGGWLVWVATAFAILGVSVFGHGAFYSLIKKYDISLLSPLTLMTPIWGVILSIALLGEPLTLKLIVGAAVSLGGVFVIAVRGNKSMPEASLTERITSSR